jgi:hypothetical protein
MTAAATGFAHQAGMGWRSALRGALCFGTRKDAFHLATVVGRGTLAPQQNEEFVEPARRAAKAKSKGTATAKPKSKKKTKSGDAPGFEFATSGTKAA